MKKVYLFAIFNLFLIIQIFSQTAAPLYYDVTTAGNLIIVTKENENEASARVLMMVGLCYPAGDEITKQEILDNITPIQNEIRKYFKETTKSELTNKENEEKYLSELVEIINKNIIKNGKILKANFARKQIL